MSKNNQDFRVASDVCEEAGFVMTARLLRKLSTDVCKGYMVVEWGFEYGDDIYYMDENGKPREIYLDKLAAINESENLNAAKFREVNPRALGWSWEEVSRFDEKTLDKELKKILGRKFRLSDVNERAAHLPIFPESATDNQMIAITRLFKIEFYKVIEIDLQT